MKTIAISLLAFVGLTTSVFSQDFEPTRLPAIESRLDHLELQFNQLQIENAQLRGILGNKVGCDSTCGCSCITPGITFSADYLLWQISQSGLDYAVVNSGTPGDDILNVLAIDPGYSSGVRSRLGYLMQNGWETAFAYTYYHASSQGTPVQLSPVLPNQVWETRRVVSPIANSTVNTSFSFNQDIFDGELSYWHAVNESAAVRLFGGIRGAVIEQSFMTSASLNGQEYSVSRETSDVNAIGVRSGAEGEWQLTRHLTLSGTLAGSVLYADVTRRIGVDSFDDVTETWTESRALPVLETSVSTSWRNGPFAISTGYELSTWFALGNLPRDHDNINNQPERSKADYVNDILLDGFFFRIAIVR